MTSSLSGPNIVGNSPDRPTLWPADSVDFHLVAAPFTAFADDGSVSLPRVADQRAALLRDGVEGAFICGSTGEASSLSTDERMRLAEAWLSEPTGLRVIVHVGHANVREAQELAAQAAALGADAIAAVPPYYLKPTTVDALVDATASIASAAPQVPFLYYHIPSITGVDLPMSAFMRAARQQIPNFAGIKYTDGDLAEFDRCLELAGDELLMMFGRDEILLSAVIQGAVAAVGSSYNYAAPIARCAVDAHRRGDHVTARTLQRLIRQLIDTCRPLGGLPAAKAIVSMEGIELGPCRLPLTTPDAAQREHLRRSLRELDFFATLDKLKNGGKIGDDGLL